MALFRCSSGGGGGLTRTELWNTGTIPSTYSGGTITLSDSMLNYDYLELEWKQTASADSARLLVPVSDFVAFGGGGDSGAKYYFGQRSSVNSARYFAYGGSNTSVTIGADYRLNAAASYNNLDFPISITGIKVG